MKTKQNKTLQESAEELKRAVDTLHEARIDFMNTYAGTITKYDDLESWADPTDIYFHKKFGEKLTVHDITQE